MHDQLRIKKSLWRIPPWQHHFHGSMILYLLCQKVQPALQSVRHLNLAIWIIDLNSTRAIKRERQRQHTRLHYTCCFRIRRRKWIPLDSGYARVWREEVVLVDPHFKTVLHGCFVDGDVFLHGSLTLKERDVIFNGITSQVKSFIHFVKLKLTCTKAKSCLRQRIITLGSSSW